MVDKYLLELGYNKDEIDKIRSFASLRRYSKKELINRIKEVYYGFLKLSYSKKDIISMTVFHPGLFAYSIDTIKCKIFELKSLGFDKNAVSYITKMYSKIFSLGIDNI